MCTLSMPFQSTACTVILHFSCWGYGYALYALSGLSSLMEVELEMSLHTCINNRLYNVAFIVEESKVTETLA